MCLASNTDTRAHTHTRTRTHTLSHTHTHVQYGKKAVDKDSVFIRKLEDDESFAAQESKRMRDSARRDAARRRAGN
jgi:hypothetical protein